LQLSLSQEAAQREEELLLEKQRTWDQIGYRTR